MKWFLAQIGLNFGVWKVSDSNFTLSFCCPHYFIKFLLKITIEFLSRPVAQIKSGTERVSQFLLFSTQKVCIKIACSKIFDIYFYSKVKKFSEQILFLCAMFYRQNDQDWKGWFKFSVRVKFYTLYLIQYDLDCNLHGARNWNMFSDFKYWFKLQS